MGLRALLGRVWSRLRGWAGWLVGTVLWLPRTAVAAVPRLVFGSTESYRTRIASVVMALSAVVVAVGVYASAVSGLETGAGSGWVMTWLFRITTSLWTYVLVGGLAVLALKLFRERREASLAAEKTGFSQRSVRRLAAETRTTDGCTTVVVSPSDSLEEITDRVLAVLGLDGVEDNEHLAATARVVEGTAPDEDHTEESVDTTSPTADPDGLAEQVRLARLELASSISFRELLWRFFVPAVATFLALVVFARIWVAPWLYPVLAAAGVLVGSLYYQYTAWRRRRRLASLRQPTESPTWSDIAVLVKRVETADTTAYYGWVAGRCYADYDAVRLATTVAGAAYAHVHDEPIPPTIQEKFARNLRQHVPNLRGYEENVEKPEIMDTLGHEVAREEHDLVPKRELAARVISRDREQVGGIGYDPRVVGECYERLVPYVLVEESIEVTTGAGEQVAMTAVRLRTSDIPMEKATAEAEFSTTFDPNAACAYPLPEVDQSPPVLERALA